MDAKVRPEYRLPPRMAQTLDPVALRGGRASALVPALLAVLVAATGCKNVHPSPAPVTLSGVTP